MNTNHWIISKKTDLTVFLIPLGLAFLSPLSLLIGIEETIPFWAFILFIVAFDVAHVWATMYRTYFDPEEFNRRKMLYLLPIPVFMYISLRLHYYSPQLFWTILAYVAIYHFIRQNYGFLIFYKLRRNETSAFDFYLDKWTLYAGAFGPVLWWHATPKRQFDWFNAGESFIFKLDPKFAADITAIYILFLSLYAGRQIYLYVTNKYFNAGKNLIMTAHFITWFVGIALTNNPLISAAFLNLFHGIPFIYFIWYYCNQKWYNPEKPSRRYFIERVSKKGRWFSFFLFIFMLAMIEEFFWDLKVWQTYIPDTFNVNLQEPDTLELSIWIAFLSLSQIMHYFLDGWIWKFNKSNPDLKKIFRL